VAFAISGIVAPSFRRSSSNTIAFLVFPRPSAGELDFLNLRLAVFLAVAFAATLAACVAFPFLPDDFRVGADRPVVLGFSVLVSVFIVSSLLAVDPRVCRFITQVREESELKDRSKHSDYQCLDGRETSTLC
jgi:hypothetical protein